MGIIITISTVLFLILCILLNIIILLQSEKSAGMGILGGSSQSTFGSSTADVISKATGVMITLYMLGSLGLAALESARSGSIKEELLKPPSAAQGAPEGVEANPAQKNKTEQSQPER
jgi:preprotein translocase subunit SecG